MINYYPLCGSAATCQYCKILFDGVIGVGYGQNPKNFSFSVYSTLRLTVQDLMQASGIQRTIEYYRDGADHSEAVSVNSGVQGKTSSASAIKLRTRPTQFWD